MFDFVLVLKAACCTAGSAEGGEEDAWGWSKGGELGCPFGGVVGNEGGEFFLGSGSGGLGGAAGEGVDAGDGGIGKEGSENVASLMVERM